MTCGMPPSIRFIPPPVFMADIGTPGSFQSITWCSKNTASPWASAISATGTISPSIWQVELENRNSVMSRSRGASAQPESETRFFRSSGAPQVKQLVRSGSFWALHHWHSIRSISDRPFLFEGFSKTFNPAISNGTPAAARAGTAGLGRWVTRSRDYEAGGFTGVPHSAQNLAVGLRLALQLVQCFCIGWPHSGQNLPPAGTWLWQLAHSVIAAGAAG